MTPDRTDRLAALCHRANRIVARVFGPLLDAPHGFYDPEGFVESCIQSARRNELRREIIARLMVKEGLA